MFRPVFEQNKSGQPVKIFWNSIFGENGILILFSRMEKKSILQQERPPYCKITASPDPKCHMSVDRILQHF